MICSSVFFLLRYDDPVLCRYMSPRNHAAPTITATSAILLMFTLLRNPIWIYHHTLWHTAWGFVELILVLVTTPVVVTCLVYIWHFDTNQTVRHLWTLHIRLYSVTLLSPLYLMLLVCGTSYTSWALAVFGFSFGIWIWWTRFKYIAVL